MTLRGRVALFAAAAAIIAASSSRAADSLWIRLAEPANDDSGISSDLRDVADVLRKSFSYKSFRYLASSTMELPAKKVHATLSTFSVRCNGDRGSLSIEVWQGRSCLLKTTVSLKDGTPLIMGGLANKNGEPMILIFIAK